MEVNKMGVIETCWKEDGTIATQIPKIRRDTDMDTDAGWDRYRIF